MEADGRRYTGSYAIRDDDFAAMREILRHSAKVNTSVLAIERPLHEAAKRSLDTVELFIEYGANVKVKDVEQNTSARCIWQRRRGKPMW
jgi:hypothetical protein